MILSATEIHQLFEDLFHQKPQLFFSPGRINLIGEHIDYNNGFVMPAAIDKGIWYAVAPNNSNKIHVYSADMNEHLHLGIDDMHIMDGWKNYILGVVDQLIKRKYAINGFNAVFGGNLPLGAGMSSSAAVECGLAFALNTIFDLEITRPDIALICQKAEHTFPKVNCGIMDQFANMMGIKGHVLQLDCDSLQYKTLAFNMQDYKIVLINSRVHHELTGGEYNIRRKQCDKGLQVLKAANPSIKNFRDISFEMVEEKKEELGDDIYRRCLYVTQEIERTQTAAKMLEKMDMKGFGQLMFQTHEGLSRLYDVSCKELDFLVEEAKQYPGIIGARLMGGGFGGCTINIIYRNGVDSIVNNILKNYKEKIGIETEAYVMNLSDGTHAIPV